MRARVPEGRREHRIQLKLLNNLLTCRRRVGVHANIFSGASFVFELYDTVNQGKQRIVFAATDVLTRLPLRTALSRENIPAEHALAAKLF
jgi:hypothetical protein